MRGEHIEGPLPRTSPRATSFLTFAVEKRQSGLELELAEIRGIPLTYVDLVGKSPVPFGILNIPMN